MSSSEEFLKEFLDSKGIDISHETSRSWIINCISPDCRKPDHMYIFKASGVSKCFKCGGHWDLVGLVSVVENVDISTAKSIIYGRGTGGNFEKKLSIENPFAIVYEETNDKVDSIEYIELSDRFTNILDSYQGMQYLEKRNITDIEIIKSFDLRWHEEMQSVVFPIKLNGFIYGWQARKIDPKPDEPRLLTKTGMNKALFLLNYDKVLNKESVVIVEGPFDCIKVQQAGIDAVCSFGKETSKNQIELLIKADIKNIYVGLDPDAYKEAMNLIEVISEEKNVFRMLPPEHRKDFGECTSEEISESFNTAHQIIGQKCYIESYINH